MIGSRQYMWNVLSLSNANQRLMNSCVSPFLFISEQIPPTPGGGGLMLYSPRLMYNLIYKDNKNIEH
jgi:hypothetical protein